MSKLIQDISIGDRLRNFRKAKGLTQEQVCAQMDLAGRPMCRSTYAQIESGARNIFISDLIVLQRLFEVSFDDIFSGLKPVNKYD